VRIYFSSKFGREYKKLPMEVKEAAEEKEKLFRINPFDPMVKTHKLTGKLKDYWSFSVNSKYRIIFEFVKEDIVWFHSVGSHRIYGLFD